MRPLLILDCDEVILDFAEPFRRWLADHRGIELRLETFALAGNMRWLADDRPVERADFPALLDGFFTEGQGYQAPAEGALAALAALSADMDLVVLTNIGEPHRDRRRGILKGHGLDVEVHANAGPKGPMVRALAGDRRAVFVDDLPPHHASAAEHAPGVGRLHMVADRRLRPMIAPAPMADARIDDWAEALPWIRARVLG